MRDKTTNFRVGQNRGFRKRDTTGDFERQKRRFVLIQLASLGLSPRNINETEKPQHKTTYFNFCGIGFYFFWYTKNMARAVPI